jgi:DNA-binding GntR family transcriptional regulator
VSLSKTVLRERVKEHLIECILRGEYPPGARLVETQIAQGLGVSQAPVREAMRDLEALRFVEHAPYRGARVRRVSETELAEIYPVRAALEEVAGRAAANRLDDEGLAALERELSEMFAAADAGDVHRQITHDVRFHEIIVRAAQNTTLFEVWRSLRIEARTMVTFLKADVNLHFIAEKHRPVLDALRTRDPDVAGRTLRDHVESFGAFILGGES